jgi:hypothetical protein
MRIVPVNRIMTAWRIFNRKEPTFLSWKILQWLPHQWIDLASCASSGLHTKNI